MFYGERTIPPFTHKPTSNNEQGGNHRTSTSMVPVAQRVALATWTRTGAAFMSKHNQHHKSVNPMSSHSRADSMETQGSSSHLLTRCAVVLPVRPPVPPARSTAADVVAIPPPAVRSVCSGEHRAFLSTHTLPESEPIHAPTGRGPLPAPLPAVSSRPTAVRASGHELNQRCSDDLLFSSSVAAFHCRVARRTATGNHLLASAERAQQILSSGCSASGRAQQIPLSSWISAGRAQQIPSSGCSEFSQQVASPS